MMPRWVSNEAKQRMVKVNRQMVIAVRAVRNGRRRIVEIPMLIAAMMVLKREMSDACTVEVMPCIAFSSTSNFCMMMKITRPERETTAKPRKMMIGVCAMAKAGCDR